MGRRSHLCAALLSLALSVPAMAQAQTGGPIGGPIGGLQECAAPYDLPEQLFDALKAQGWRTADPADLVEKLLWITATVYISGDTGGTELPDVVAAQRRVAANYGRLKALPTGETRIMTRDEDVLIASWQMPLRTAWTIVQCRAALIDAALAPPPEGPGFGVRLEARITPGAPGQSRFVFQYDAAAVRAALPGATPPDLIVNVRNEYQPGGVR